MNNKQVYHLAAVAAIIQAILAFPLFFIVVFGRAALSGAGIVISFVMSMLILYGYLRIARKTKNPHLYMIVIGIYVALVVLFLLNIAQFYLDVMRAQMLVLVIVGVMLVFFGVDLIKLAHERGAKKVHGALKGLGVLHVVQGVVFFTMLLLPFDVLLAASISVLEAIFFIKLRRVKHFLH